MIKITDSEQKLTDKEINDFELEYSIELPENYKMFLKKHNGGSCEDSDYVDTFLSLNYGKPTVEYVLETHQITEQNIPLGHLVIALDWSDNPITINLNQGERYGQITQFYFDSLDEPEIIADSLENLLKVKNMEEL